MQRTINEHAVQIPPLGLSGDMALPENATGIILFAHGSGSSRHSSRNRYVAGVLQEGGFATLLLDLLDRSGGGAKVAVEQRAGDRHNHQDEQDLDETEAALIATA